LGKSTGLTEAWRKASGRKSGPENEWGKLSNKQKQLSLGRKGSVSSRGACAEKKTTDREKKKDIKRAGPAFVMMNR